MEERLYIRASLPVARSFKDALVCNERKISAPQLLASLTLAVRLEALLVPRTVSEVGRESLSSNSAEVDKRA